MLRRLFDPTGASGRLDYVGRLFLCATLTLLSAPFASTGGDVGFLGAVPGPTFQAATGVLLIVAGARRLRDLGASPWIAVLPTVATFLSATGSRFLGIPGLEGAVALATAAFVLVLILVPGYGAARRGRAT